MTTALNSDRIFRDYSMKTGSNTRPINNSSTTTFGNNNSLTTLPSSAASRIDFKSQPKASTQLSELKNTASNQQEPSLSDINFRLLQTKLAINEEKYKSSIAKDKIQKNDRPLYYQPPSSSDKDIYNEIKDCLPPNVNISENLKSPSKTKYNIPKLYNYETTVKTHDYKDVIDSIKNEFANEDLIDFNPEYDNPTGIWESPIVKEAIARQIDLEYYMKVFIRNILYLLIILLFRSLFKKGIILYELHLKAQPLYIQMIKTGIDKKIEDGSLIDSFYFILVSRLICLPSIINILFSFFKLMKGQDQCWDLPLSTKQRKLLGLNYKNKYDGSIDIDEDAELTLKQRRYDTDHVIPYKPIPKYVKNNESTKHGNRIPLINENQQSLYSTRKSMSDLTSGISISNNQILQKRGPLQNSLDKVTSISTSSKQSNHLEKKARAQANFTKNYNLKF
ncbi:uncharacterized protein KGF55_005647 [Candida pseudojiufengensis]|uniref:uncharacterized protein n=1 Tax=Candida pseudojiufengensis TaxID=497109 RepID=UPI002225B594|nr:uncharacterized protein KGF55_005647 [Candida pseudojiufengensis]KAI5958993.1 hypothetical protein KGF55_005647 [Candida pseudojiufengensis]